jgi:hypothetical protein
MRDSSPLCPYRTIFYKSTEQKSHTTKRYGLVWVKDIKGYLVLRKVVVPINERTKLHLLAYPYDDRRFVFCSSSTGDLDETS